MATAYIEFVSVNEYVDYIMEETSPDDYLLRLLS